MEKELRNTREIIEQEYGEFPETILHAELCLACARVDGRSIKQSLKAFALARIEKVESKPLKGALEHGMQRYSGAMQKLSEGD
ncbi:TPA: hypothetical protein MO487_000361 [Salmonella enterica subsp. houtenae serovar 43:z4,z23:-]|nr:hypothetical protein [Salmonella enterica]EMC3044758.1 hypothetical protein [Salmonella enterica]HCA3674614.1 hypothetical protein [Salmonella enterica subsp. houtenae serovar Houten]